MIAFLFFSRAGGGPDAAVGTSCPLSLHDSLELQHDPAHHAHAPAAPGHTLPGMQVRNRLNVYHSNVDSVIGYYAAQKVEVSVLVGRCGRAFHGACLPPPPLSLRPYVLRRRQCLVPPRPASGPPTATPVPVHGPRPRRLTASSPWRTCSPPSPPPSTALQPRSSSWLALPELGPGLGAGGEGGCASGAGCGALADGG